MSDFFDKIEEKVTGQKEVESKDGKTEFEVDKDGNVLEKDDD